MRLFVSATAATAILTAGTSLAVVMLRSPLGDPVFERASSPQADHRLLPAALPIPGVVLPTRRSASLPRSPGVTGDALDATAYTLDAGGRSPAGIGVPGMAAVVPRPAPPRAAPDAAESIPRVMYCHLDTGGHAATLLQECLDRAPAFSSVEIPPGTYTLHRRVVISRPVTLRTAGTAGTDISCVATSSSCATLLASYDFIDPFGVLLVRNTGSVMLQDLVIDGNRSARLASTAARWCERGRTSSGFNAAVLDCEGCSMDDVVSKNALCGTGLVWSGARAAIGRSEFRDNGDAQTPHMWADGLTVVYAPDSTIAGNRFVDNSDIGLIVGHAARSRIERNTVIQRRQRAFAGLMLDNFNSNDLQWRGDFRGATVAHNLVDCGAQRCLFGIQVGPSPWYPTRNVVGGELLDNDVRGARVGINIDGAGVRLAPLSVSGNTVQDVPGGRFSDCARVIPTAAFNISPTSIVRMPRDVASGVAPDAAHLSDPCQFWSAVAATAR